ncbi:TPA: hypothetical protein ACF67X_004539 [Salmonella enterica]|nr:hypothetical protein [Salmonella enterica]
MMYAKVVNNTVAEWLVSEIQIINREHRQLHRDSRQPASSV